MPSEFDELFVSFKKKFPPVQSKREAAMLLTTAEITETFTGFYPELEFPRMGITRFLKQKGYQYEPINVNEQIRYFWLIGQGTES